MWRFNKEWDQGNIAVIDICHLATKLSRSKTDSVVGGNNDERTIIETDLAKMSKQLSQKIIYEFNLEKIALVVLRNRP